MGDIPQTPANNGQAASHPGADSQRPCVYFIQDENVLHIKIGWALDANARLAELQVGNPSRLVLLTTMPGGPKRERRLHRRFAASRARGEWFRPTPDLLVFLLGVRPPDPVVRDDLRMIARDAADAAILSALAKVKEADAAYTAEMISRTRPQVGSRLRRLLEEGKVQVRKVPSIGRGRPRLLYRLPAPGNGETER